METRIGTAAVISLASSCRPWIACGPQRTHRMELTAAAGMFASLTTENRPTVCRHADWRLRGSAYRH
jgi:hypothetical protein